MAQLTLESLVEMWKEDVKIQDNDLDGVIVRTAILHSKYLEFLSNTKLRLKRKEMEMKTLFQKKFFYYNGKMTKEEMDELGWPYDPFKGCVKPLKGDLEIYYDADKDLQELKLTIQYLETLFEALEEIMGTIKFRGNNIKSMIEWKKFIAGA